MKKNGLIVSCVLATTQTKAISESMCCLYMKILIILVTFVIKCSVIKIT